MPTKKNILIINGSASENSSNERLIDYITNICSDTFHFTLFNQLKQLPHFDPFASSNNTPEMIIDFRNQIQEADGIIICTPEYIFSVPSGLKNAIEWSVSTTVFSDKPLGIITASADGRKGHESLQLIMQTVMAVFTEETTLLIQGIRGKINDQGMITDEKTKEDLNNFIKAFQLQVEKPDFNTESKK